MSYQVDILLPLKLQKILCYFGLCYKILLAYQFAGFFTFDLFDLLILILGSITTLYLLYILSKRFFLKYKGLSDARVVSVTKKEYGFVVHFF